ncbi:MAG: hypothetical protein KTR13_04215 [Saprospiraceae bacterium]|nr:hypothetical protein [Saprospiraceae bacterium]
MKNIIFTLFLGLFTVPLFAQDIDKMGEGTDPVAENNKIIQQLDDVVELTDPQKLDVTDILSVSQEEMRSIKDKYQPTITSMKAELKEVREKYGEVNETNRADVKSEIEAIKSKYNPNLNKMKSEIQTLRRFTKEEIGKVLTPAQREQLREARLSKRQQWKNKIKDRQDKRKQKIDRPRR